MVSIRTRTVGTFDLKFLNLEKLERKEGDKEDRVCLHFASEIYFSTNQGGRLENPDQSAALGSNWKSKMALSKLEKYRHLLRIGGYYKVKAAIDSYQIGTNSGSWYEVLEIEPISSHPEMRQFELEDAVA